MSISDEIRIGPTKNARHFNLQEVCWKSDSQEKKTNQHCTEREQNETKKERNSKKMKT